MNTENNRRSFLLKSGGLLFTSLVPGLINAEPSINNQQPMKHNFFPGFKPLSIKTSEATINGVMGGSGPPLLLLHGYPQSHIEWHKIAPMLAKDYTLVITDLRGYGDSSKPEDGVNHYNYSKRAMAKDQVEVMEQLGFQQFSVLAHDRGARVAHRMALDYPEKIQKLAIMDIVPTYKLYTTTTKEFASRYWHWFFLIQPAPMPEKLLHSNETFLLNMFFYGMVPQFITKEAFDEYLRHFKDADTLHAMCEDYRAGAGIDLEHDKADLEVKIKCPLLVLWGSKGAMDDLYDVLETWRERAEIVSGKSLPCGHWMPEQMPEEVYIEVYEFLKS